MARVTKKVLEMNISRKDIVKMGAQTPGLFIGLAGGTDRKSRSDYYLNKSSKTVTVGVKYGAFS
jgi:hypothetical protein